MAKVRVYELARELNMDSKDLVEKLLNGGVNIKNYMSTLDETSIQKAREIVSGVVSEVVEEKRIKPTVIRRRKKIKIDKTPPKESEEELKKEVEAPIPEIKEEEEVEEQEDVRAEAHPPEEPIREPEKEEPPQEPRVEELPPSEEETKAEPEEKPKRPIKRRFEEPAKIIKLPDKPPKVEAVPEVEKRDEPVQQGPVPVQPPGWVPPSGKETKEETKEETKKEKPKKRKKGRKKEVEVETLPQKMLKHKKKEIYEKADLYNDRPLKRKAKKVSQKGKAPIREQKHTEITVPKAIKRRIKVQEVVTVGELAKAMGIKGAELIKRLMVLGTGVSLNQSIDFETASVVADDLGYELELGTFKEEQLTSEVEDTPEDLKARPPVVTIMGHVDHGKTSLLDYIRQSNIIDGESGGITQHIGAYYVKTDEGDVVFLDTPGHEAFTAMRARGAEVTDLIVLVVAADDGVMPQTKEAINHARAADIPIVVAVNKIDKAEANPDKVKRELAEQGLTPEDWGGDTIFAHISAKTGEGVDELLGLILLQSEMLELSANPNKKARGTIIEAKLDKSKGPVCTALIKSGTLHKGEYFVCGDQFGRVRAMNDHRGKKMKSAGPSVPVEIYGISGVPMAGDEFIVVQDEKSAKQVVEHRKNQGRKPESPGRGLVSLDDLYEKMKEGKIKELNIVLKTDVQGSLEALSDALIKQGTDEVRLKVIHAATGAITESDIMLASASNAMVIGFNVRANPRVSEVAEKEGVDIRYYDVIYETIKDVRAAMAGLLDPVKKEKVIGHADVKEIFHIPKAGTIAGCHVSDGSVKRNASVRLLRDDVVVFDGKLSSLRRFKDDVKEVASGYECGIGLEGYQDIKPGDVFEIYEIEEAKAEL